MQEGRSVKEKLGMLAGRFMTVLLCLALGMVAGEAWAARTITSVTLDGGSATTVAPGASIAAVVNLTTDGSGSNGRWRCTAWRIATSPPGSAPRSR